MNIRHIEYFVTLARERNFSKASEAMNITQPTLSQCIQKMEQTLGAQLFDRSFSSLTLTPEGEVFLDGCLKILDIYKQTTNEISEMNQGVTGTVKVGVAPFRMPFTVSPIVNDFHKKYPNVHFQVEELNFDGMTEKLDMGEIDLAVTAYDERTASKYEIEPIVKEEVLIALHKDIVAENPALREFSDFDSVPVVDISAFRTVDFILLGQDQLLFRQFRSLNEKCSNELHSFTTCTGISNSLSLADSGSGAALIPSMGLEYYKRKFPDLRYFSIGDDAPERTICVIYRKNQYLSAPAKEVIRLLMRDEEGNKNTL